jgi:hypothetical protein
VYEMRRGSSDTGFNLPFGQNQQWNRDQEAGVGGEVRQEGDAYVVPDRHPCAAESTRSGTQVRSKESAARLARWGDSGVIRPSRC